MIQRLIPTQIKASIRNFQRKQRDQKTGIESQFANIDTGHSRDSVDHILVSQPLRPGNTFHQKVKNNQIGASYIEKHIVHPNEVFSFWHAVPRPTQRNGFVKSRNLVNGQISTAVGGGICQLASITYHSALLSGMEIIERHNHSLDIYEESDRFTPLGADAAVVWGHKDLRFRNNHDSAIWFSFEFAEAMITLKLHSAVQLPAKKVEFKRLTDQNDSRLVHTLINENHVATSRYQLLEK